MKRNRLLIFVLTTAFVVLGFAGQAQAELIYGMTTASSASTAPGLRLVSFDSATPGILTDRGAFTGIVANHSVRSIDFRPATGVLYAISSNGTNAAQLYTVNLTNAVLTPVGAGISLGTNASPRVEMDFNPTADRIRVITGSASTANNNFRVNPNTGTLVLTDTNLVIDTADPNAPYTGFSMIAAAYSNNTAGAASTTLYVYDYNTDAIFNVGSVGGTPTSPNTGIFFTADVPTGFLTTQAALGMDISGATGTLFVVHDGATTATTSGLFTRTTNGSGVETPLGLFPAGTFVSDISVVTPPTAAGVDVSGRVLSSAEGRGLRNAMVTLTDQSGVARTTLTSSRGNYQFADVEAGGTYVISVRSRRFSFSPRVLQITDNISDLDFVPEQ